MIPSPTDIAYFMETAQTGNVTRAAERLGISQPSLSLALQRLETATGEKLLLRGKRGVALTRAGQAFLAGARGMVQEWEKLRAFAHKAQSDVGGTYTIGCHATVGLHALPCILPELMAEYPALNIKMEHGLSRRIAEGVVSMTIDMGIVVNPLQHPDLVIRPLCRDDVTIWRATKVKNKDVLICDPGLAQSQYVMRRLKKAKMHFSRIVTSDSLENIAALTAAGCGYGILPAQAATRAPAKLSRVEDAPSYQDEHCLIYRVENKTVRTIQAIAARIRDAYGRT